MGDLAVNSTVANVAIPNSTSPPLLGGTGSNISWATEFGSGAITVGEDIERRALLVRLTNGEIWNYPVGVTAPALVFPSGSDASSANIQWMKYHHSWGFASFIYMADEDVNSIVGGTFDSGGDYVNGPYTMVGTDAFNIGGPLNSYHHTDPSGNFWFLYDEAINNQSTKIIRKNNVGDYFGKFSGVSSQGTRCIFHDGTDVYGSDGTEIFLLDGAGGATSVFDLDDLVGVSGPFEIAEATWDDLNNVLKIAPSYTDGFDTVTPLCYAALDLSFTTADVVRTDAGYSWTLGWE